MVVYIIAALAIIAIGALFYKKEKPSSGLWVLFLILVTISVIRGEMAMDHPRYNRFFEYVAQLDIKGLFTREFTMERGFVVLSKIISTVSQSNVLYASVLAILTMGFSFSAFGKRSKIPWLSVLVFFSIGEYFDSFNLVRQVLAVAICFFATKYINEKKRDFWKYLALVLLASTLHSTAMIVMIPAYFILRTRFTVKSLIAYTGIGVGLYAFFPQLINIFINLFPQYDLDIYGKYVEATTNINSVIPSMGVFVFVIICVLFFKTDFDMENYENRVAMNGLALLVVLLPLGLHMEMAARLSLYFRPFVSLTAVNVIANFKSSKNRTFVVSAVAIAAVVFIMITHRDSPYSTYYVHDEIMELFR